MIVITRLVTDGSADREEVREALVVVVDLDADRFTNLFQARDRDLMRRRR
jgi:hypothetical protein